MQHLVKKSREEAHKNPTALIFSFPLEKSYVQLCSSAPAGDLSMDAYCSLVKMICNAISYSLVQFLHRMRFLHPIDHVSLKRPVRITYFKCHLFLLLQTKDISMQIGKKTHS